MKDLKNQVEALLFASGKPITIEDLARIMESPKTSIKKALSELKKHLESIDSPLMVIQEGDSWKMNVREAYLPLVRKIVTDTELSKATLETLAVVAWKSPVKQSEIIEIRGNKAYEHIHDLEELGFVKKDKFGRTFIVKLAEKFFEYFDIEGEKGIREVFKDVKKRNDQQKLAVDQGRLGELDVYEEKFQPGEKIAPKEKGEMLGSLEVVQSSEDLKAAVDTELKEEVEEEPTEEKTPEEPEPEEETAEEESDQEETPEEEPTPVEEPVETEEPEEEADQEEDILKPEEKAEPAEEPVEEDILKPEEETSEEDKAKRDVDPSLKELL